mmetsp:Transcript_41210/g.47457  ORF Transcript_41210/g.47457 Transcript_41210/m.47457 type:complete len:172 (-) Transcript_41210:35-550(-)
MTSEKHSKELDNSNLQAPYAQEAFGAYKSSYSRKSMKSNSSVHSGKSGYKGLQDQGFSSNMIENFAVKKGGANQSEFKKSDGSIKSKESLHDYNVPTLELLNPEMYKENQRKAKIVKDNAFESLKHIKDRYNYHELRAQRAQKRTEEIARELEAKREEEIMKKRKKTSLVN